MNPLKLAQILQGSKTYIVGAIMIINVLYTLVTGEQAPTFNDPTSGNAGDLVMQAGIGSGLVTLRAAITGISKRLDTLVPPPKV